MTYYLDILSMKAVVLHIERVTASVHDSAIQVRFKLQRIKCVQIVSLPIGQNALHKNTV